MTTRTRIIPGKGVVTEKVFGTPETSLEVQGTLNVVGGNVQKDGVEVSGDSTQSLGTFSWDYNNDLSEGQFYVYDDETDNFGNISEIIINATSNDGVNRVSALENIKKQLQNNTGIRVNLSKSSSQNGLYQVRNISIENSVDNYRGYKAVVCRVMGNDPSINQMIIYKTDGDSVNYTFDNDTNYDDFAVSNLGIASQFAVVVLYGNKEFEGLPAAELSLFFKSFVDNVFYDIENPVSSVDDMNTNFYTRFENFKNTLQPLYENFEFQPGWGSNYISDGGDDQYDNANYLNSEFSTEIPYGVQNVSENDYFGTGSKHIVAYQDSIFALLVENNSSNTFYFSGNLGADGSGTEDAFELIDIISYLLEVTNISKTGNFTTNEDESWSLGFSVGGEGAYIWDGPDTSPWTIRTFGGGSRVISENDNTITWFNFGSLPYYNSNDFRGGIIEYHAYCNFAGTIIGKIIISRDGGSNIVTHEESYSGNEGTLQNVSLWECDQEGVLGFKVNEGSGTYQLSIQYKVTAFYGEDYWD